MKKVGAFLLILLCVLTCVVTSMGDFLYGAFFGGRTQGAEALQSALTMDENGIVYYVENLDGVNHIVKVDDAGNIIVDEELPVMRDADRFLVQNMYVTGDQYIYVAGFEADLVARTALRAVLVVLDENGALYATPYDQPITPSGIRAPRTSAMFAAMNEDEDRVYFAYANQGQAAVMAHDKSDAQSVTDLGYYQLDGEITALFVSGDGRLIAADAQGQTFISQAEGSKMAPLGVANVHTFQMYAANGDSFYYRNARDGGVGQVNFSQRTNVTICPGSMSLGGGGRFSDFSQVAVGARGKMAGLLDKGGSRAVYTGSESRMTASPAAHRSLFDLNRLIAVAVLVGAALVTVLLWDIYCNLLKMRISVLVRQALLISMSLIVLCYVLLNVILKPELESAMTEQYEHQVLTAARTMASGMETLDAERRAQAMRGAGITAPASDGARVPVYFSLVRVEDAAMLEATNESGLAEVAYSTLPFNADLNDALRRALEEGEALVRTRDTLGDSIYALAGAGENHVVVACMNASNVGTSLDQLSARIRAFLLAVCAALFVALLLVESLTVRSLRRLRRGVDAVSAGNYEVSIDVSSGDEVENLAHAFMAMARKISGNTKQLTDVSSSYYRFVPENFVQLLGESSIEKVGKSSYVEKSMTVMTMHFTFADERVQKSTGDLFRNVNNVIEHLSPVVTEEGGTVYNFNADGFIAVFDRSADALRAALRLREAAMVLDKDRRQAGMCAVDVRVVLSGGDVMLGIVGDEKRMAPAVVSDVIAMSQRLVALQRPSGVYILCTQDVARSGRAYRMRRIGLHYDQGNGLELYDVYDGDPYALLKTKETIQPQFEEALRFFEQGDMAQARLRFMQIVKIAFDDGVSRNYLYCADALLSGQGQPGYRVM